MTGTSPTGTIRSEPNIRSGAMTIEDASIVDAIGTNQETGTVHLSVFAHLQWDRRAKLLLEEKINRYLGFIEADELAEVYPSGSGRQIAIDVYCKFRPTDDVVAFFGQAAAVAAEYGAELRYAHAGNGYADDCA